LAAHRAGCARTGIFFLALAVVFSLIFLETADAQTLTAFSETSVGASAAQTITVTAQVAGTVSTVNVLTLGQPNLDYTATGLNTCAGANLSLGGTCQLAVTFSPRYPGTRNGAVVLLDAGNNVLATHYLTGAGRGPLGVMVPGTMETAVGSGEWTAVNDGQPAAAADLYLPSGVAVDGAGNIYIADSYHNRIREVYATGPNQGLIETICNVNGVIGYTGDGQSALNATLNDPRSIAIDGAGNLYIADSGNNVIREINIATGNIATIAGNGSQGYNGDGPALGAALNGPYGVTVDASGNLYIADTNNQRIREYTPATGNLATVAGNGYINANAGGGFSGDGGSPLQAELNLPYAVAFDAAGNMYIPDSGNNRIRIVYATGPHAGTINTFAGTGNPVYGGDGQSASAASFYAPSGVAVDVAGNLYIADTQNNRIRKISASTGLVSTIAGNGIGLYGGDGASASLAGLFGPYGLFLDSVGNLYIADYFDHRIRSIASNTAVLTFTPAIREDQVTAPQIQTIENDGNAAMTFATILPDANAKVDAAETTCSLSVAVNVGATCNVAAEFAPTTVGNPVIGNVDLTGNPANAPLDIRVVDQALALTSTTTTLTASPNPAFYGSQVALSASVTTGTGTLSGSVTFKDGSTVLGTVALSVGGSGTTGSATYTTSSFTVSAHSLTATYSENGGVHSSSTSSAFTENIQQPTSTTVASSENPSVSGDSVTFTATVTASADGGTVPTGTVVFYDGTSILGSATLTGSAAALTTSSLTVGTHAIKAAYSGDSENGSSTSAALSQLVKAVTTVSVAAGANPASLGSSVTFTATVHGNGGTPTGSVAFTADGSPIGSPNLSGGSAAVSLSTLAVGTHSIVATYAGDANDAGATSPAYTETVGKASTTTTLASAANPSASGQTVTFTVTVHGGATAVTGTVALADSGNTIATASVGANGAASFTTSTLAVGAHSLTAIYSGDANYTTSTSAVVSQRVLPNTLAVVQSSANPSIAGSSVTFTVTVTGATTPSGSITLKDGSATLAGLVLNSSGIATYATTALAVGTHTITAIYGGDANNAGTTSAPLGQVVNLATTTTSVTAGANPATAGKSTTLTAVVTGAAPTGVVKFYSQGAQIGSANLNGSGVATYATSTLAVGSDAITAAYAGDARNSASTSAAYALNVVQATTTVSLVSSQNPAIALRPVTFTASVTGTGGTPPGQVIFSDGASPLATVPLSGGIATYSTSSLAVGQHAITAAYQGDADDVPASAALTQAIQQASPALTVLSNLNPASIGTAITFTATLSGAAGTPAGAVTFNDGGAPIGTVNLAANGSATLTTTALAMGQHTLTAAYSGDANNAPASSAPFTETIQEATTTTLVSSNNPSIGGTSVTFTATVTGAAHGNVTGTVTFKNGATTLGTGTLSAAGAAAFTTSSLPVGSDAITAVYAGDTLNAASASASLPQTVQSAVTGAALASSSNPAFAGTAITFTATVTGNGATPTGSITFMDGAANLATVNLNASGIATYTTSVLAVGVHPIKAVYSGDAEDQPATSAVLNQAVQAHVAVALTSSLNPALAVAPVTFNITVTDGTGAAPTGAVTLFDGTSSLAQLTLSTSGTATYTTTALAVGAHTLTAVYAGDTIDASATSNALTQTIQAIPTKTTLGASSATATTAQPLTLVASLFSTGTVPITGTVTFQNGSTVIGSTALTAAGTATITPTMTPGAYNIVAVYSGDANNATSTSVPVAVTVTQATGFQMSLNPASVTVPTSDHTVVSLTLQSMDGFSDTLGLGCGSLPPSITCNFSQPTVSLASNGTETVQLTIDTASPLASGATAKNERPGGLPSTIVAAWLCPASALFGIVWWRSRRKLNGLLCAALVILLSATALTLSGCGGISDSSAKPGTYTIQVTADGANTGMTNAVNVTVVVSQ
jgi:hypothetical protein